VSQVVHISDAASLAMHTMTLLAAKKGERLTAHEVATLLPISEAHLAQVLQRLARAGLVDSTRGPHGGFTLARAASRITLLEVYEAIEGPMQDTGCLLGLATCSGTRCIFGDLLETVNRQVRRYLAGKRLSQLADSLMELVA
jgi:Rrf2 family protein